MSNGPKDLDDLLPGADGLVLPGLKSERVLGMSRSPCDDGEENDVAIVHVRLGQRVNLRVVLCNSLFRVRVFRDQTVIFDQQGLRDEVNVPVEGLTRGAHSLVWAFLAASSPWKTRSEVSVDGNIEFCLKKGTDSSIPSNQLVVFLQVT